MTRFHGCNQTAQKENKGTGFFFLSFFCEALEFIVEPQFKWD